MNLPKRVFNSPVIMLVNYTDETYMNLIKLKTPYANGHAYAVYSTDKPTESRMYKTEEKATAQFNKLIDHSKLREEIWTRERLHGC